MRALVVALRLVVAVRARAVLSLSASSAVDRANRVVRAAQQI